MNEVVALIAIAASVFSLILTIRTVRKIVKKFDEVKPAEEEKSEKHKKNLGVRKSLYDALNWFDEMPSSVAKVEAEREIRAAIATLEDLDDDQA